MINPLMNMNQLSDLQLEKTESLKSLLNQQYTYTTFEAISTFKEMRGSFDWLPSKEGLTINQWWVDRIFQQRSASNLM